jgi:hypothetical protein
MLPIASAKRARWNFRWLSRALLSDARAVVTHPKIYRPPTPPADALTQIDYWLESPSPVLLHEGDGCWDTLRPLVARSKVQGICTPRIPSMHRIATSRMIAERRHDAHFTEYFVNAPPACTIEFGPSAA